MDAEKIFYGIARKKRRRFPSRLFLAAAVVAAGFVLLRFGFFADAPFWKSDEVSRELVVRNTESRWISTKKGYLFLVRGEVMNQGDAPVSYVKLKSVFHVSGRGLGVQELYCGNTLSARDLKNADVDYLLGKLGRKGGDDLAVFADAPASANLDVQPGNAVPFYSFYLSGNKILGIRYEIEILDFEVGRGE